MEISHKKQSSSSSNSNKHIQFNPINIMLYMS